MADDRGFQDVTKNAQFDIGFDASNQESVFVKDPFGNPIPVLPREGETVDDATKRTLDLVIRSINQDPKTLGQAMAIHQIKKGSEGGDPLDPEFRRAHLASQIDGPVVPGDIEDILLRADLARSDLITEKAAKLKEVFPDSELKFATDVAGDPTILIRHANEAVFREVEAPEVTMGDLGALVGGAISEDVAGELIAFIGSRGTSLVKNMIRAGVGAVGGELAKTGVEAARGFEHSERGAITERILTTGVSASFGTAIFDPVARIINIVRGVRGITVPTPEAREVRGIAAREGLPAMLPGQLHPVYESIQQQAAGTSQTLQTAIREISSKTVERLDELKRDFGDFRDISDDVLRAAIDKEERDILALMSDPGLTFSQAGRKVVKGFENFTEMLAEREGRLYKAAFEKSKDVRFNALPAQQIGAMIRSRIVGKVNLKDIGLDLDLPLIPVNSPAMKSAMRDLQRMNSEVKLSPGNASPLEQMVRLRSTFFNLADDPSLTQMEQVGAKLIHRTLTQVMLHPRGPTGVKGRLRPTVARAWREAASHSTARERFLSRAYRNITAANDTPSQIAKKLNPNTNPDFVLGVRRRLFASGQREKWFAVEAAYRNKLLTNPSNIANQLRRTENKEAIDAIIPPRNQAILMEISDKWAQLHSGPVARMLRATSAQSERALQLVQDGTFAELRSFIKATGGRDTAQGRALQAGVIESLLNSSTKIDKGKVILKKETFLNGLSQFRQRGILKEVFSSDVLKRIDDFEKYVSFMPSAMGVGEGIQKAEVAAGAGSIAFPTPGNIAKFLKGASGLTKNAIIAWAFTTPKVANFLVGKGKILDTTVGEGFHRQGVRIAGALGVIVDNMAEAARSGSFDLSGSDIFNGPVLLGMESGESETQ